MQVAKIQDQNKDKQNIKEFIYESPIKNSISIDQQSFFSIQKNTIRKNLENIFNQGNNDQQVKIIDYEEMNQIIQNSIVETSHQINQSSDIQKLQIIMNEQQKVISSQNLKLKQLQGLEQVNQNIIQNNNQLQLQIKLIQENKNFEIQNMQAQLDKKDQIIEKLNQEIMQLNQKIQDQKSQENDLSQSTKFSKNQSNIQSSKEQTKELIKSEKFNDRFFQQSFQKSKLLKDQDQVQKIKKSLNSNEIYITDFLQSLKQKRSFSQQESKLEETLKSLKNQSYNKIQFKFCKLNSQINNKFLIKKENKINNAIIQ